MYVRAEDTVDFRIPDFDAPFDVEAEIEAAPSDATVRGMFFEFAFVRALRASGKVVGVGHDYNAFGSYPMRDYLRVLVECAQTAYPDHSLRDGIRLMGSSVFDDFYETMVGRAIFSVAGRSMSRVATIAPRAYAAAYSHCEVKTWLTGPSSARVSMAPMYIFPDTFHYGAWENAARFCGVRSTMRVYKRAPGFAELEVLWR